jgi:hypothetical protein
MTFPIPVVIEYGVQPSGGGVSPPYVPPTNIFDSTFVTSRKVTIKSAVFTESVFRTQNPLSYSLSSAGVRIRGVGYKFAFSNGAFLKFDTIYNKNETIVYATNLAPKATFDILAYSPYVVTGNQYEQAFTYLGYAVTYGQLFALLIAFIIALVALAISKNGIVAFALLIGAYAYLCTLYYKVDPTFLAVPISPTVPINEINSTIITAYSKSVVPMQNDLIILTIVAISLVGYFAFFKKKKSYKASKSKRKRRR